MVLFIWEGACVVPLISSWNKDLNTKSVSLNYCQRYTNSCFQVKTYILKVYPKIQLMVLIHLLSKVQFGIFISESLRWNFYEESWDRMEEHVDDLQEQYFPQRKWLSSIKHIKSRMKPYWRSHLAGAGTRSTWTRCPCRINVKQMFRVRRWRLSRVSIKSKAIHSGSHLMLYWSEELHLWVFYDQPNPGRESVIL